MADILQKGFRKLMRYAQNLAEYNKAIEDGIIDENVFVIVLDEKVAKFKGLTFDWNGGGTSIDPELSDTSENPVQNKVVTSAIESIALELGEMVGDINTSKADKAYVDNAIANAITTTLNTAV